MSRYVEDRALIVEVEEGCLAEKVKVKGRVLRVSSRLCVYGSFRMVLSEVMY